ncbi:hypothetical protein [Streptomyces sp. NPDC058620]|uniref:hypothetical protein n=1 Tax=Streptomyces sp. NPDC058620 TaxID=3346560 RepID=UPI00364D84E7
MPVLRGQGGAVECVLGRLDLVEVTLLRHTYAASVVLEAMESVVTLARWLGHASPTITLDHYAHFMPEAGRMGRRAIDSLLDDQVNDLAGRAPQILPRPDREP